MTIRKLKVYIVIHSIIVGAMMIGSHYLPVPESAHIFLQIGIITLFPVFTFSLVIKCYALTLKKISSPGSRAASGFSDIIDAEKKELEMEKVELKNRIALLEKQLAGVNERAEILNSQAGQQVSDIEKAFMNFFVPIKKIFYLKENNTSIAERITNIIMELYTRIKNTVNDMNQQSELLALTFESYGDTGNSLRKVDTTITDAQDVSKDLHRSVIVGQEALARAKESMADILSFSKEMGGIITLIVDIAERTDLLAINASIESAHTGVQGKGFSVIAQEIKKLASNSKGASNDVKEIINNIIEKNQYQSELIEHLTSLFDNINAYIEKTIVINEKIYKISKEGMIQSKEVQTAVSILDSIAKKIVDSSNKELLQSYEVKNIMTSVLDLINENYDSADKRVIKLLDIEGKHDE